MVEMVKNSWNRKLRVRGEGRRWPRVRDRRPTASLRRCGGRRPSRSPRRTSPRISGRTVPSSASTPPSGRLPIRIFFFSSEHTKPGRTLANSFSKHLQYDMSGIELSWFDWTCLVVSVFSLLKGRKFPECWNLCKSNWLNLVGQVISFPGDNFKSEVKISVAVELEQIWLERFRCHSAPLPFLLECSNSECYRPGDDGRRDEFDENTESEHCGQHLDAAGQEGQQNGVLGTARTRVRVPGNRKPMEIESTIEIGPTP